LGKLSKKEKKFQLEVALTVIDSSHPLFRVDGTNKGIVFYTDTMDSITVTGGKSDPRGTGASLLKDIINIYRK
jgi:homoserine dehydrogenase